MEENARAKILFFKRMEIRQTTSSDGGLIENEAIATDHVLTASVAHLSQNPGDNTSMRTCCHSSLNIAATPKLCRQSWKMKFNPSAQLIYVNPYWDP